MPVVKSKWARDSQGVTINNVQDIVIYGLFDRKHVFNHLCNVPRSNLLSLTAHLIMIVHEHKFIALCAFSEFCCPKDSAKSMHVYTCIQIPLRGAHWPNG